jgi:hypothetical protein
MLSPVGQVGLFLGCDNELPANARGPTPSIDLRDPAHANQCIGPGTHHHLLEVHDLLAVAFPRSREDPLS